MDSEAELLERFSRKWLPRPQRALVVGAKCYGSKPDRRKLYAQAIGVDLFDGEGVDLVHDLEAPLPESVGKFDFVDCVSTLEHVRRPWVLAENIERALEPGGSLLISVPFAWRVHAYPNDLWRMTTEALPVLFPSIEWRSLKYSANGRLCKLVPRKADNDGRWIGRAEVIGAGIKCR